jgi:hypothetical protein
MALIAASVLGIALPTEMLSTPVAEVESCCCPGLHSPPAASAASASSCACHVCPVALLLRSRISNSRRLLRRIAGKAATNPRRASALNRPHHHRARQPDFAPGLDFRSGLHFSKIPFRKENYEIIHSRHRSGLCRSGWFCPSRRDFVPEMLQGQGLRHLLQRQVLRV